MADIVDSATRSRMMSGIRGKNTKMELLICKRLFALGFRYRLHSSKLPGKPDIVLPRYRAVIFLNGCFWHAHDCHLFRFPETKQDFWRKKLAKNKEKDAEVRLNIRELGWRVLTIWECAVRGKQNMLKIDKLVADIANWLYDENAPSLDMKG